MPIFSFILTFAYKFNERKKNSKHKCVLDPRMFVSRDFEILLKWKSAWIFYYIQNLSYLYDWVKLAISILIETFTIFNHKYFANLIWTISYIECKCILYTQLDEREVFFSTNLFRFSPQKRRKISNHFANKMALLVVAFVFQKKTFRNPIFIWKNSTKSGHLNTAVS